MVSQPELACRPRAFRWKTRTLPQVLPLDGLAGSRVSIQSRHRGAFEPLLIADRADRITVLAAAVAHGRSWRASRFNRPPLLEAVRMQMPFAVVAIVKNDVKRAAKSGNSPQ